MADFTRILDRVGTHGTAATELYLVLFALRGVALAIRTIRTFTTGPALAGQEGSR